MQNEALSQLEIRTLLEELLEKQIYSWQTEENSPWLKLCEVELSRQARVTGNSGVAKPAAWTTPGPHGARPGHTGRHGEGTPARTTVRDTAGTGL